MVIDWDKVVEDLGPRLYRYFCVRFTQQQADDLTQETLLRLVRKVNEGSFDPEKGTLQMLGFGIAHYVALESKQGQIHESIDKWENFIDADIDIEQIIITKDDAKKVVDLIRKLSNIEQQVLSLTIDEDLTIAAISKILQIPEGTIKSHIFRAKKKLMTLIYKERGQ